jgi:hypothetical protein
MNSSDLSIIAGHCVTTGNPNSAVQGLLWPYALFISEELDLVCVWFGAENN